MSKSHNGHDLISLNTVDPAIVKNIYQWLNHVFSMDKTSLFNPVLTDLPKPPSDTNDHQSWERTTFHYPIAIKQIQSYDPIFSFVRSEIQRHRQTNETSQCPMYLKMIPLVDPIRIIHGKKNDLKHLNTLPTYSKVISATKEQEKSYASTKYHRMYSKNHTAYVETLFSHLQSELGRIYGFPHTYTCYCSFMGIKKNAKVNISGDIGDIVDEISVENYKHWKSSFTVVNTITQEYNVLSDGFTEYKNNYQNIINLENECSSYNDNVDNNTTDYEEKCTTVETEIEKIDDFKYDNIDDIFEKKKNMNTKEEKNHVGGSDDSDGSDGSDDDDDDDDDDESVESDSSENSFYKRHYFDSKNMDLNDEKDRPRIKIHNELKDLCTRKYYVTIPKLPVSMTLMERCDNSLSTLLDTYTSPCIQTEDSDRWFSCFMQLIMILSTYQRVFDFTHNDLHVENILYNQTDYSHLLYRIGGEYYLVPTYGKIYKIIDFGRSIFSYQGKRYCNDDLHPKGYAAGQYNTEPYYNPSKKRVDPNPSFDLCLFATTLYDSVYQNMAESVMKVKHSPLQQLIQEWASDDQDLSMVHDEYGNRRYEGFDMYSKIARHAHHQVPHEQLTRPEFEKYHVKLPSFQDPKLIMNYMATRYPTCKSIQFVDIDAIPSMQ
mgnify:CR=1 FL=1